MEPCVGSGRATAAQRCHQQRWKDCAQSLDQARKLDRAGESQEGVVKLREAIARADRPSEQNPEPPEPTFRSPELEVKPRINPSAGDERAPARRAVASRRWLDERGQLWTFYAAWRDGVASDPTGEKASERVVGTAPAGANAQWTKWVLGGAPK